MSTAERLHAEVERLRDEFDPVDAEARRIFTNGTGYDGKVPEELERKRSRLGQEVIAALNRLELELDDAELRAAVEPYKDLRTRADQATTTRAQVAQEYAEAKAPTRYDPETGGELDPLGVLNLATREIGGNVRWVRVRQVGEQDARWYLSVWSGRSDRAVELKSFTTTQLFESPLSKLAARVREVKGGRLPTPRRGSDNWIKFTEALEAAAEFEEHGATEEGAWRRRLAAYLTGKVDGSMDPTDPRGKAEALAATPGPLEDAKGRLWVHAGAWLEYLETRRMEADDAAVRAALRHLGFEPRQVTAKVAGTNRSRWYWVSPEGFDWQEERA